MEFKRKCLKVTIIIVVVIIIYAIISYIHDRRRSRVNTDWCDIAIIGGGVAGCCIARRLHEEHPHLRILMLERGGDFSSDRNVYNVARSLTAAYTAPYSEVLSCEFPQVAISAATMYGGGSSHNFSLCVRGSFEFYKENWNMCKEEVIRLSKKIETFEHPSDVRGCDGPVRVNELPVSINIMERIKPVLSRALELGLVEGTRVLQKSLDVARSTGPLRAPEEFSNVVIEAISKTKKVPIVEDYNDGITNCVTKNPQLFVDLRTGLRSSVDVTYLSSDFIARDSCYNLHQSKNMEVQRLIMEKGSCVAVESKNKSGNIKRTCVRKMAIMAAGGLYTPFILKRSGFNSSKIGEVNNHYGCTLIFQTDEDFNFSSGPMSFVPRNVGNTKREWQTVFGGKILVDPNVLDKVGLQPDDGNFTTMLTWILDPISRGSVGIKDNKIDIKLGYGDDNDSIIESLLWMYEIAKEIRRKYPSLKVVFPPEQDLISQTNLDKHIYDGLSSTDHYCSTVQCLDSNFLLEGTENVYVGDTSSFPAIPDGNTEFPTLIMAEKVSEGISDILQD